MTDQKPTIDLAQTILSRIDEEHIVPHSRTFFLSRESLVWLLWVFTVSVGALSWAVILIVLTYNRHSLYEFTHETRFSFWFEAIPYIWIAVFGLMLCLAIVNLRQTKKGYRYSISLLIISSLVGSVVFGIFLHMFGIGFLFDDTLGKYTNLYRSQAERELQRWQRPEAGRLVGTLQSSDATPWSSRVEFIDKDGQSWQLVLDELSRFVLSDIPHDTPVRLIGVRLPTNHEFLVCGILPWIVESNYKATEIAAVRERMILHSKGSTSEQELPPRPSGGLEPHCADLPVMQRLRAAY